MGLGAVRDINEVPEIRSFFWWLGFYSGVALVGLQWGFYP